MKQHEVRGFPPITRMSIERGITVTGERNLTLTLEGGRMRTLRYLIGLLGPDRVGAFPYPDQEEIISLLPDTFAAIGCELSRSSPAGA